MSMRTLLQCRMDQSSVPVAPACPLDQSSAPAPRHDSTNRRSATPARTSERIPKSPERFLHTPQSIVSSFLRRAREPERKARTPVRQARTPVRQRSASRESRSRSPVSRSSSVESPARDESPVNFTAAMDPESKRDISDDEGDSKKISAAQYKIFRQAVSTSKGSYKVNPAKTKQASRASLLDLGDTEVSSRDNRSARTHASGKPPRAPWDLPSVYPRAFLGSPPSPMGPPRHLSQGLSGKPPEPHGTSQAFIEGPRGSLRGWVGGWRGSSRWWARDDMVRRGAGGGLGGCGGGAPRPPQGGGAGGGGPPSMKWRDPYGSSVWNHHGERSNDTQWTQDHPLPEGKGRRAVHSMGTGSCGDWDQQGAGRVGWPPAPRRGAGPGGWGGVIIPLSRGFPGGPAARGWWGVSRAGAGGCPNGLEYYTQPGSKLQFTWPGMLKAYTHNQEVNRRAR